MLIGRASTGCAFLLQDTNLITAAVPAYSLQDVCLIPEEVQDPPQPGPCHTQSHEARLFKLSLGSRYSFTISIQQLKQIRSYFRPSNSSAYFSIATEGMMLVGARVFLFVSAFFEIGGAMWCISGG